MREAVLSFLMLLVFSDGAVSGSLELTGSFTQGGLVQGKTDPGTIVVFQGRTVQVSPQGVFLIGFGRDEQAKSKISLNYPDGSSEVRDIEVRQREYQIQRIDGLDKKKVDPPKETLDRIYAEYALARKARKRNDPRLDFSAGFVWPARGPVSGVYGSQRILNGQPRRPHFGVDVAAPEGTPVYAPAPGIVSLTHPDMYFSGGTLILDHGHGLSSSFLHLSKIVVSEGQRIRQGDKIAEIGATGRVTGAHLDWRMNLFKKRLDPELLVGPMPQ